MFNMMLSLNTSDAADEEDRVDLGGQRDDRKKVTDIHLMMQTNTTV